MPKLKNLDWDDDLTNIPVFEKIPVSKTKARSHSPSTKALGRSRSERRKAKLLYQEYLLDTHGR